MRWHLQIDTRNGVLQSIGGAKTRKERDQIAWGKLTCQLAPKKDGWKVLATDTRTGTTVELSLPLRRRTIKEPATLQSTTRG